MSQTTDPSIYDPDRPHIAGPDEDPGRTRLLMTLINPFGSSSKHQFTRAWTVLFAMRVVPIGIIIFLSLVSPLAPQISSLIGGLMALTAILFVLTILFSIFIHIRRLADAGRSPLWAMIVVLPVIAALGVFMATAGGSQSQTGRDSPPAVERTTDTSDAESPEAAASGDEAPEADSAPAAREQRGRGGRGGRGDEGRAGPAVPLIMLAWVLTIIPVTIWSLMWVARLPRKHRRGRAEAGNPEIVTEGWRGL